MGGISVIREHPDRLLTDSRGAYGAPYQEAFAELARTHRGRPAAEVLPLLERAADERALLGLSRGEQAEAVSSGEPYMLRVTVT
ncbi:hypothetical protein KPP03845_100028 [Streptomyces xanthophaeus]|uniref:hypothetical protein n=1 Tax=Streptomyces xanthophaeus TaxID=67385 RepID=UPI00233E6B50|nr:hypothetical protein [Streptomyces xanthophaeus]WCD83709.1 hypothetical protein KPP03845_100028 [Streptomyces xanthophaeus]